jgi:hypothetical protein
MRRLLLCLPVYFVLLPGGPRAESADKQAAPAPLKAVKDDGAALPDNAAMTRLAKDDPIRFLENCLKRYDREVQGYRCTLVKQERLEGKLQRSEVTAIAFRERPFSVLMEWKQGARLAQRVLYVKGANDDKLVVKPSGLASLVGVVERDPEGPDARKSGRYPLTEFGIKIGMERTLAAWDAARKDDALHVEYLGERKIPEVGGRPCWVLKRTGYKRPEEDGITELTTYIDTGTWLQVGSVVKGAEGQVLGAYYFRDIQLNPKFPADTFTRQAVKGK